MNKQKYHFGYFTCQSNFFPTRFVQSRYDANKWQCMYIYGHDYITRADLFMDYVSAFIASFTIRSRLDKPMEHRANRMSMVLTSFGCVYIRVLCVLVGWYFFFCSSSLHSIYDVSSCSLLLPLDATTTASFFFLFVWFIEPEISMF